MIVLGIDPGQTGGLALVSEGRLLNACPIPCTYDHTNKPTLAWATATIWLNGWDVDHAVIENVHAMPAQGVASSFQFGRMFGAAEMFNACWATTIRYVEPQVWKRYFGIDANKHTAVAKATQLYGDEHWPLKKHEGVAEAALIATWGLHQLLKE